jgi:hypothetical protein
MTSSPRVISGKYIVAVMFTFGIIATGTLWFFWYYHTQPFIPLQKAIAAEYPDSAPRVDGGQRRMHSDTPRLLWIIMRVKIHPSDDAVAAQQTVDTVTALAKKHVDISLYDQINVRLFRGDPEKQIHKKDFEVVLRDATKAAIE